MRKGRGRENRFLKLGKGDILLSGCTLYQASAFRGIMNKIKKPFQIKLIPAPQGKRERDLAIMMATLNISGIASTLLALKRPNQSIKYLSLKAQ